MTDAATARRVFAALSAADLATLSAGRAVVVARVWCVTDEIRATHPAYDEDDCEYVALLAAADDARSPGGRRVIAAADVVLVSDVDVDVVLEPGRIVSFHVDEHAAGGDDDLMWFDVTELPTVLALVASG